MSESERESERDLEKRRAESRKKAWEAYVKAGGTMAEEPDESCYHDRIGFMASGDRDAGNNISKPSAAPQI